MSSSKVIIQSSLGLVGVTIMIKTFGYGEKLLLSFYSGTNYEVDAFNVVMTFVLAFFFLFREIIEPAVMNIFTAAKLEEREHEGWRLGNFIFYLICICTSLAVLLIIINPRQVVGFLAPGFNEETAATATGLLKLTAPAIIFISISTLTNIILNSQKLFFLPALGDLVFKLFPLLTALLFYPRLGIHSFGLGVLLGAIGRIIVHVLVIHRVMIFTKPIPTKGHLIKVSILTWPLLLGVFFSQLANLVDNAFASGLPAGSISALGYARKVVELPVLVFPYLLSVVIFPYFTQWIMEKQHEKVYSFFVTSAVFIMLVFLPMAAYFIIFSHEITEIIFQRGAFDAASTNLTANAFLVFAIGLPFFALETLVVIFYYSKGNTRTPVFLGIFCVLINVILTFFLIRLVGYMGIALAFVIQKTIKNVLLVKFLKLNLYAPKGAWKAALKFLTAFAVFVTALLVARVFFIDAFYVNPLSRFFFLGTSLLLAASLYVLCLYLFSVVNFRGLNLTIFQTQ